MNYDTLRNAVFKINTSQGSGSGFYLDEYDLIVTNFHVIEGNRMVALEDQQQDRYIARVVFGNPETDIAFLKAETPANTSSVAFDNLIEVNNRDKVWVIGYPFGMPYTETEGIVSNNNQLMNGRFFIQIDAAVNPGNSGGPVVDRDGRLIGVTTAKFTNAENMGFAIPGSTVLEDLDSMKDNADLRYAIKCNSCKNLIYEKTDYCPICGASIDEELFVERSLDEFGTFVEAALSDLGMNPLLARAGYDFWMFHHGSSQIRIFVYNKHYLYCTSPLNQLPSEGLDKLYAYLLSDPVPPYKLGVYSNQIYITYRFHISDIYSPQAEWIKRGLAQLPVKADEMDDFFVEEFGCEKTHFAKDVP